jgi:hypothetical protein
MMSALAVLAVSDPEVTFTRVALLIAFMTGIAVGVGVFMRCSDTRSEVRTLVSVINARYTIEKIKKERRHANHKRLLDGLRAAAEDADDLADALAALADSNNETCS